MKATHLSTLSAKIDEVNSVYYETDSDRFLAFYMAIYRHNELLKETVKLSMFVPCGEDGKPFTKHSGNKLDLAFITKHKIEDLNAYLEAYNKALEAVIFEGWEVVLYKYYEDATISVIRIGSQDGTDLELYYNINYKLESIDGVHNGIPFKYEGISTIADLAAATALNPLKLK